MISRRTFLQSSSLLALSSTVPLFLARSLATASPNKDARVLVVVELDGGNDALNTLIPYKDENYARLRPRLKIDAKNLVRVNDALGFHPSLRPLDKMFQAGQLAVLPGVGYPNPNRSHFESMAIWHTARFDPEERKGYGWLGRALDPSAGSCFSVGSEVPIALRGRRSSAVALKRLEDLLMSDATAVGASIGTKPGDDLLGFIRRQAVDAQAASETLARLKGGQGEPRYPQNELAERLMLVARLLKAGVGARVFYTQQSGYDTHSQQQFTHGNLLGTFASAVAAFFEDLKEAKLNTQVTLMAFSEFGRTIKENGSAGTDHGTAGLMFVAGPTVQGGVIGTLPNLQDLDKGEPKMKVDFRAVYSKLLEGWLGLPGDAEGRSLPGPTLFSS